MAEPRAIADRLFAAIETGTQLAPFSFANAGPAVDRAAPRLGEHTAEIMHELGRPDAEVIALRERGVIA